MDINDEIIIGYINNTLSKSDRTSVEREMQYNSDVVNRYKYLSNKMGSVPNAGNPTDFESQNSKNKKSGKVDARDEATASQGDTEKTTSTGQFVLIMLLFIILSGVVYINIQYSDSVISNNAMNDEGMKDYASNIKPVEGTTLNVYRNAYALYHKRNYSASYMMLNNIKPTAPTYQEAQYAMAIISYRVGQYEEVVRITSLLLLGDCLIKDKVGFLRLNAMIQWEGYDPLFVEEYLDMKPDGYYRQKARLLEENMDAPIRSLVFI